MKNAVFWDLRRVALVSTDVSEELSASFIGVTRISELGTTLAVTSNRRGVKSQKTPFFKTRVVKTVHELCQWYTIFSVHVPSRVISLQLCTPKVAGV
jgi:hypothetical protein